MKRMTTAGLILAVTAFSGWAADVSPKALTSAISAIPVPAYINVQGKVTPPPLTSPQIVSFTLSTSPCGSSGDYWHEDQSVAFTADGLFGVQLGAINPITSIPEAGVCYLKLSIGGQAVLPPTQLVSVPYAWNAAGLTSNQDGICRANVGNTLYGSDATKSTQVNLGVGSTTGTSGQNYPYCTVGGGWLNTALDTDASVGGGWDNTASGAGATVGGGMANMASGEYATVSGGGGPCGLQNIAAGKSSAVGGGGVNNASGDYSTVGGGHINAATSSSATVGGGTQNIASGVCATVGGGLSDTASGDNATVGGGNCNIASVVQTTVSGGYRNSASGAQATVGGGSQNDASNTYSTVGGGYCDTASGSGATVGGGVLNTAARQGATVGGGAANCASGDNATVGGGNSDSASGSFASVVGGYQNTAAGSFSFAAGFKAKSRNQGCFTWSDNTGTDLVNATDNCWVTRAQGGVYFYTNAAATVGSYLPAGGNSWQVICDRTNKENFKPVDRKALLERLARMPVQEWNLKSQDPKIRHIGPVAQDFHAAFGYGESDKSIGMSDMDGVTLAAIQALCDELKASDARIAALEAEVARLRR